MIPSQIVVYWVREHTERNRHGDRKEVTWFHLRLLFTACKLRYEGYVIPSQICYLLQGKHQKETETERRQCDSIWDCNLLRIRKTQERNRHGDKQEVVWFPVKALTVKSTFRAYLETLFKDLKKLWLLQIATVQECQVLIEPAAHNMTLTVTTLIGKLQIFLILNAFLKGGLISEKMSWRQSCFLRICHL